MTLKNLTDMANVFSDETVATSMTVHFFNTGISEINTTLKSKLPLIDSNIANYDTTAYTAFGTSALGDSWLIALLVPYIAYSIKMNDGSLNEAQLHLMKYREALNKLKKEKKTVIAEEYRDSGFSNAYLITPYSGWYGAVPSDEGF